jgi:hypothetical protein
MLKFIVDDINAVDEAFRAFYKKRDDGKWQLDVEGAEPAEAIAGLKNALASEKLTAKQRQERLDALEKGDLVELQRLREEDRKRREKDAHDKGDWETLKNQLVEQHQKEIAELTKKLQAKDGIIEQVLVDNQAMSELAAAQVVSPKVMLPHIKPFLKVIDEDGKPSIQVVDEKGKPRLSPDGKGSNMTVAQLIESFKQSADYQPFFKGTGGRGGGSDSDAGKGGGNFDAKPHSAMTDDEKSKFITDHGLDEWRAKVNRESGKSR